MTPNLTRRVMVGLLILIGTASRGAGVDAQSAVDELAKVPRTSMADFRKQIEKNEVVIVDVRGPNDYRAGHIPGALNVPVPEVAAKAEVLKKMGKPIVMYCG